MGAELSVPPNSEVFWTGRCVPTGSVYRGIRARTWFEARKGIAVILGAAPEQLEVRMMSEEEVAAMQLAQHHQMLCIGA